MKRTFQTTSIIKWLKPIRAKDFHTPLSFISQNKAVERPYILKKLFTEIKKSDIKEVHITDYPNINGITIDFNDGKSVYQIHTINIL